MAGRVTSENTRRMFADALKQALKKKRLSQITVRELVEACGVNHKTFYYHFHDIYALVRWMLERETADAVQCIRLSADYETAIHVLLACVRKNSYMLNCLYNAIGERQFRSFFYDDFVTAVRRLISTAAEEERIMVPPAYSAFLCDFLTKALSEILLDYIMQAEHALPEDELVRYIVYTFRTAIAALLAHTDELAPTPPRENGGASCKTAKEAVHI